MALVTTGSARFGRNPSCTEPPKSRLNESEKGTFHHVRRQEPPPAHSSSIGFKPGFFFRSKDFPSPAVLVYRLTEERFTPKAWAVSLLPCYARKPLQRSSL